MLDWRETINLLDETVALFDREARFLFLNEACARPFGRPVDELVGLRLWDLVPPVPRTVFREAFEGVLGGGGKTSVTAYVAAFDRWYEFDIYPHPDGALVVSRDMTLRTSIESSLRESEERFRVMIEHAPEAIVIQNLETMQIEMVNAAAEKLFGRQRGKLVHTRQTDLSPSTQSGGISSDEMSQTLVREILERGAADFEWTINGPDGGHRLLEVRARRLPSKSPPLAYISVVDITARRTAQEQIHAAQRLEALGRLAGGVAHDFNNILAVILGSAQLGLRRLPTASPVRDDMLAIANAAERAALLTRQLLAFGRNQKPSPRLVDLSAYVETMRSLLVRLVGEDIEVALDLARPLASASIDPAQLEQILLNLASNARDAMPKGGRLTIRTANLLLDKEYERQHGVVPPGRYVLMTVADTGEGIPLEVKPHIFEPFFTTKELHRGTGLGLATVYGIVQQNAGHIWVYSEPGMGATFKVYLPIVDAGAAVLDVADGARSTDSTGTETIVVVDDDDDVRQFVRRTLERSGYAVLEARNAGEALLIFEQHEPAIPLLVTDVVMPRMTGPQLAARLRKIHPGLAVVFLSGYSEGQLPVTDVSERGVFLAKPVGVDALLTCVRNLLDAGAHPAAQRPSGSAIR